MEPGLGGGGLAGANGRALSQGFAASSAVLVRERQDLVSRMAGQGQTADRGQERAAGPTAMQRARRPSSTVSGAIDARLAEIDRSFRQGLPGLRSASEP